MTRVRPIRTEWLQAFVDDLSSAGLTRYDTLDPNSPARAEMCLQIGAHSVVRMGDYSDRAHLVFMRAAMIPLLRSDPELLVDYANDVLGRPAIVGKNGSPSK